MRGWYLIDAGRVVKLVHVDDDGHDTVRAEVPAGFTIGGAIDLVMDTGEVRDGDLLVLTDGSQIRLGTR